jgi:hypothetical protein
MSSFERVEEFKRLGTTLRNQNSILEEIKSRLKSECLLSEKFKDEDIQNYNFASFVWV